MVTVKEIAQTAGVSPSTVSIVINGKGDARAISQTTQEKVRAVARQLGYQPSISARALRDRSSQERKVIGLFFGADYRSAMMNRFTNGLWAYPPCQASDVNLVINPYTVGQLAQSEDLRSLSRFHGVILCNMDKTDMSYLQRQHPPMPAVLYNRFLPGYSSVTVDDAVLGHDAATAFICHGRKRALYLGSEALFEGMNLRLNSFMETCRRNDVEVYSRICENSLAGGYAGIIAALDAAIPFDCVFCGSGAMAFGALRALDDRNIGVPNHVELIAIGNGDPEMAVFSKPSLSEISVPIEQMAQECFRLVMLQIEHQNVEPQEICMPLHYLARESTQNQ